MAASRRACKSGRPARARSSASGESMVTPSAASVAAISINAAVIAGGRSSSPLTPALPLSLPPALPRRAQRRGRVVAQRGGQQVAAHRGDLGQPRILPGVAQAARQLAQQPAGQFLILLGTGLLRRGEEQRRLAPGRVGIGQVDQQRRVDHAQRPAGGAGHGVQRAGPRAIDEIGALAGVDDEPDLGAEGSPALRALEVGCLRVGVHGVFPGVGALGWRRRRRHGWTDRLSRRLGEMAIVKNGRDVVGAANRLPNAPASRPEQG